MNYVTISLLDPLHRISTNPPRGLPPCHGLIPLFVCRRRAFQRNSSEFGTSRRRELRARAKYGIQKGISKHLQGRSKTVRARENIGRFVAKEFEKILPAIKNLDYGYCAWQSPLYDCLDFFSSELASKGIRFSEMG